MLYQSKDGHRRRLLDSSECLACQVRSCLLGNRTTDLIMLHLFFSSPPFDCVGEEKQFSLYPSEFLAETPVIEDRLTREKQTSLLTYVSLVYLRAIQGKMSNSMQWLRTLPYLQQKTIYLWTNDRTKESSFKLVRATNYGKVN